MDSTRLTALITALTFMSAALQRFIETFDWLWTSIARFWCRQNPAIPTPTDPVTLAEKKGQVILIVSTAIGCAIASHLPDGALTGLTDFLPEDLRTVVLGFMLAGTTNGTNSVLKYLSAAKDSAGSRAAIQGGVAALVAPEQPTRDGA